MKPTIFQHFKGVVFHVFPHHAVSRITRVLARLRTPLVRPVIRAYIRFFGVDMSEARRTEVDEYECFNDFFTRELRPGVRPVSADADALVSPCDAALSTFGRIDGDKLLQVKGREYTLGELLVDRGLADKFTDGFYCTLYLSPASYHRVHMPASGVLRQMVHAPGRLFSVAKYAWSVIPRLFARNERVACVFDADLNGELGGLAVVMVGALNVGDIELVWHGTVAPASAAHRRTDYPSSGGAVEADAVELRRGDEMGRFNAGSSVVMLFKRSGDFQWESGLEEGAAVRTGQVLGRFV